MTAGENIRKIRKQQGISQYDLADTLGVTHQMVSKVEKRGDHMTIETLKKFAKALHVNAFELID